MVVEPKYLAESGWWFQRFFIFIPTWGDDPLWRAFFSSGLVQPPTSWDSSTYSNKLLSWSIWFMSKHGTLDESVNVFLYYNEFCTLRERSNLVERVFSGYVSSPSVFTVKMAPRKNCGKRYERNWFEHLPHQKDGVEILGIPGPLKWQIPSNKKNWL